MERQHSLKQTILALASLLADVSEERQMLQQERDDLQSDLRALEISYQGLQDSMIKLQDSRNKMLADYRHNRSQHQDSQTVQEAAPFGRVGFHPTNDGG